MGKDEFRKETHYDNQMWDPKAKFNWGNLYSMDFNFGKRAVLGFLISLAPLIGAWREDQKFVKVVKL
jgi:hypothetical protein